MGGEIFDSKKEEGASKLGGPLYDEDDEDDEEQFVAIPPLNQAHALVKPENLKLLHRIGRGPFGDMWLANIHSHRDDFDEYHEVAVKVLPSLPEDQLASFSHKLEEIVSVSQGASSVSWPRGISMKTGKACVITKLYEMSIGDKMARLPGNCISLADALRYGIHLAHGIIELHSRGIMALNLKPFNFLLDEHDQAVLGEFGIPFLLMGAISADGPLSWLGTPNYMAPEQWEPKLRGPVSFETDSWGFACSFIEMLTGVKPWSQLSPSQIFNAVVVKGEKPTLPSGLPSALQRMLKSCFAYDRRQRPTFTEILSTLRSPSIIFREGDWIAVTDKSFKQGPRIGVVKKLKGPESAQVIFCDKPEEPKEYTGLSNCTLWKDKFQAGDAVRLKQSAIPARFGWTEQVEAEGKVRELDSNNAVIMVKFDASGEIFKADPCELQPALDILVGDWVRLKDGWSGNGTERSPSCVGIVHKVPRNGGFVQAAFLGRETLWEGPATHLIKASPFHVGQFVKLKSEVVEPRFEWLVKKGHAWETGRISCILPNGCLVVDFPGRLWNRKCCWADADEVEVVRFNECNGLAGKYEHLQAMHWAIGPALCLLGFLTAARVGIVLGGLVIRPLGGGKRKLVSSANSESSASPQANTSTEITEYRGGDDGKGNGLWLPPAVANILFKESQSAASS